MMSSALKRFIEITCVVLSFISLAVVVISPFATAKVVWATIGGIFLALTIAVWITYTVLRIVDNKKKYSETNPAYKTALAVFSNLSVWFLYGFKQIFVWLKGFYEKVRS